MKGISPKRSPTRPLHEHQTAASQTDWQRLNSMTEEEITRAAEADTDNLPLSDPFFKTARRLPSSALLKEAKQQRTLRLVYAMKMLQTAMEGEAEKVGLKSEEDVTVIIETMRDTEKYDPR